MLKKVLRGLGALVAVLVVAAGVAVGWARSTARTKMSAKFTTHEIDFPIPYPLSEGELAALRAERTTPETPPGTDVLAGVDLAALAKERAAARGKYLVEARYVCIECHGQDFGGGKMIDDPAIGTLLGKNLTSGAGGVTAKYTAADWDRIVRHAIKPDGTPTAMPSVDFVAMTDHELSDIVSYIRSMPPVDRTVPDPVYGPIGTFLVATGRLRLGAEFLPHDKRHPIEPPADSSAEFGKHVTQVCAGCHNQQFTGGPIAGGPPDWPPTSRRTPTASPGGPSPTS